MARQHSISCRAAKPEQAKRGLDQAIAGDARVGGIGVLVRPVGAHRARDLRGRAAASRPIHAISHWQTLMGCRQCPCQGFAVHTLSAADTPRRRKAAGKRIAFAGSPDLPGPIPRQPSGWRNRVAIQRRRSRPRCDRQPIPRPASNDGRRCLGASDSTAIMRRSDWRASSVMSSPEPMPQATQ